MFDIDKFLQPDNKYAPLQIVHDFDFMHWNTKDCFDDIKSGNETDYIRKRLEMLKNNGFGGVVMNVSFENYTTDEAYWETFVKAFDIADSMGFRIWIYDEQYYPTGSAGGITLKGHPEYEALALDCLTYDVVGGKKVAPLRVHSPYGHSSLQYAFAVKYAGDKPDFSAQIDISEYTTLSGGLCWDVPDGKWRVYCYFIRSHFEGSYLAAGLRAARRSINFCNREAVKRFLDVTYSGYIRCLGDRMKKVDSIFFDEPGMMGYCKYPDKHRYGPAIESKIDFCELYDEKVQIFPFIHWSEAIADKFYDYKGYSIVENLPALFEGGEEYNYLRIDYSEYIENQFINNFVDQYKEYLSEYNISVGGHYRCAYIMGSHPRIHGDILKCLGSMDIPGCDRLCSTNKVEAQLSEKLVSSASRMYGNKKTMVEASNMALEVDPLTFRQMLCSVVTDIAQGINIITSYYDETVFTREEYNIFNLFVSRLSYLFESGSHTSQALVYYPFKQTANEVAVMYKPGEMHHKCDTAGAASIYMDSLETLSINLLNSMVDFDYINDECLLKSRISAGKFVSPSGGSSEMLLFPDVDFIPDEIVPVIKSAVSNGIYVGIYGKKHNISGLENVEGIDFFDDNNFPKPTDLITDKACPSLRFLHKSFSDYELYLMVQTENEPVSLNISVPAAYGSISKIGITDGVIAVIESVSDAGKLQFKADFEPFEAQVFMLH